MAEDYNNKYYKIEKDRQKSFRKSEQELDRKYKEIMAEESRQEGLNRLHPEDSTAESEFAKGGIVGKGQGKAIKLKRTKFY
jgi:hypothetical protein